MGHVSPRRPRRRRILSFVDVDDDRLFFDWVRRYFGLIGMFVVAGVVAGLAASRALPARFEAWSVVVQVGGEISARELGPSALAIVRTSAVYIPAMREAGVEESPERFFDEHVELRPVPETDALIVVGISDERDEAVRISDAVAASLIRAFESRGLTNLTLFSPATPLEQGLATSVVVVVGPMVGLWLGLAAALIHYHLRRPVLTLERAVSLLQPRSVAMVRGGRRWLGVLRRKARPPEAALAEAFREAGDGGRLRVMVAHAGTSEAEIARVRMMDALRSEPAERAAGLVWVR